MKIIVSPAKKMNIDTDSFGIRKLPTFLEDTKLLCDTIQRMSYEEVKNLWRCNDKLAKLNYNRFKNMDLKRCLTPAILAYEGLQYQHMSPMVFTEHALEYIEEHLRILSGFYGVLTPFTGVVPYRLEMQAKLSVEVSANEKKNLYDFWGEKLYQSVMDSDQTVLNLASKEYSQVIERYLLPQDKFITVEFGEVVNGKVKQKGTYAKMARGEMVRFMAENKIEDIDEIKEFCELGYCFSEELSNDSRFVFIKK